MTLKKIINCPHCKVTLKPFDQLTEEEITRTRLAAKRAALHRAVDIGLLDNYVTDLPELSTTFGETNLKATIDYVSGKGESYKAIKP